LVRYSGLTSVIQKIAISAAPGAGIAGGVWMQANGAAGAEPLCHAIAYPEGATSDTKYWAREVSIAVRGPRQGPA